MTTPGGILWESNAHCYIIIIFNIINCLFIYLFILCTIFEDHKKDNEKHSALCNIDNGLCGECMKDFNDREERFEERKPLEQREMEALDSCISSELGYIFTCYLFMYVYIYLCINQDGGSISVVIYLCILTFVYFLNRKNPNLT
jgi:hypothetical protein